MDAEKGLVSISAHTAPIIQPQASMTIPASDQKSPDTTRNGAQPVLCPAPVPVQPIVFPGGPADQMVIEVAKHGIQGRR